MPSSVNNTTSLSMGGPEKYTGGTIGTRNFSDYTAREISSQISRDNMQKLMPSNERLTELRKSVIKMVSGWLAEDKIAIITEYGDGGLLKNIGKKGLSSNQLNIICAESIITHLDPKTLEQLANDIAIKEKKLEKDIDKANNARQNEAKKMLSKKLTYFNSSSFEEMFNRSKDAYDAEDLKKRLKDFDPSYSIPKNIEKQFPLLRKELYSVLSECFNKIELVGIAASMGIVVKEGDRGGQIKNAIINKVCLFAALVTGRSAENYGSAIIDTTPYENVLQYTSYSYLVGKPGFTRNDWNRLKMQARRAKVAIKERSKLQSASKKFNGKDIYSATGGQNTSTLFGLKRAIKKEDKGVLSGASYEQLAELAGKYGIDPTTFKNRNIYRLKAMIYASMANEQRELNKLNQQRSRLLAKGKTTRDVDDRIAAIKGDMLPINKQFVNIPKVQFSEDGQLTNAKILEAIPVYIVGQGTAGKNRAEETDDDVSKEMNKLKKKQRKQRRLTKIGSIISNVGGGIFAPHRVRSELRELDIKQKEEYDNKLQELLQKKNDEYYSENDLNKRLPFPIIEFSSDGSVKKGMDILRAVPVYIVGQGPAGDSKETKEKKAHKKYNDDLSALEANQMQALKDEKKRIKKDNRKRIFGRIKDNINYVRANPGQNLRNLFNFKNLGLEKKRVSQQFLDKWSSEYIDKEKELNDEMLQSQQEGEMPIPKIDFDPSLSEAALLKRVTQVSPVFVVNKLMRRTTDLNTISYNSSSLDTEIEKKIKRVMPVFDPRRPSVYIEPDKNGGYNATTAISKAIPVFVVNSSAQKKEEYTEGIGKNVDAASDYNTANGQKVTGNNNIKFTKSFVQIIRDMQNAGYSPTSKYLLKAIDIMNDPNNSNLSDSELELLPGMRRKGGVLSTEDLDWANNNSYKFARGGKIIVGDSLTGKENQEEVTWFPNGLSVKPIKQSDENGHSENAKFKIGSRYSNGWKRSRVSELYGTINTGKYFSDDAKYNKIKKILRIPAIPVYDTSSKGNSDIVSAIESLRISIADDMADLMLGLSADVVAAPFGVGAITRPALAITGTTKKVSSVIEKVSNNALGAMEYALNMNTGGVIKAASGAEISSGTSVITGDAPGNNIFSSGARPELVKSTGDISVTPLNKTGTEKQQKVSRMSLEDRRQALATAISSHIVKYNYSLGDGVEEVSNSGEAIKVFDVKPGLTDKVSVGDSEFTVAEILSNTQKLLVALNTTETSNTALLEELIKAVIRVNKNIKTQIVESGGTFTNSMNSILSGN